MITKNVLLSFHAKKGIQTYCVQTLLRFSFQWATRGEVFQKKKLWENLQVKKQGKIDR